MDIAKVDFFNAKDMEPGGLLVTGDKIIVPLQASFYNSYSMGDQQYATGKMGAALYNVFNTDLKPLFKAVLPASASVDNDALFGENYHIDTKNNKLYILSTINQK